MLVMRKLSATALTLALGRKYFRHCPRLYKSRACSLEGVSYRNVDDKADLMEAEMNELNSRRIEIICGY